jgi:hypothetical protein
MKKKCDEEIIYFVYATEEKTFKSISPMYTIYTTYASCSGIQLILTVTSLHTNSFEIVVYGDMVYRKKPEKKVMKRSKGVITYTLHNLVSEPHRRPEEKSPVAADLEIKTLVLHRMLLRNAYSSFH